MRKRRKLSRSSSSSHPEIEDFVEEREEVTVFPSENNRLSSKKTHLLKQCLTSIDGSEAILHRKNLAVSSPDLKALSLSVCFSGWRIASKKFKSWARKMAALHEPTWRKAGIFEAIIASTKRIRKDDELILGIAEKWCPETNTFVFPWGETTITLEDVMMLLGFSVLGSPIFAAFDSSGEKTKAKLEKEWVKIKREKLRPATQLLWMLRFMNSGDELEHVAFLALWLSYFVFPSCFYHISKAVLPMSVHLSRGTRIALAPAVLAHLYGDLTLLKTHIRDFTKERITEKLVLCSLFKLVQVWTWERFKQLQPKPILMLKGEPRLARWSYLKQQRTSSVRQILDNSKMDSFEWRPYTKTVENWKFPQFYPEKAMSVAVSADLDDDFISFARCIKVCDLAGVDCVEHYLPNRVASQFGLFQNVPCPVSRNNLSKEAAWNDYDKPIDDMTLYIPSRSAIPRFTPMFCEWWRKSFPEFHYSSKENRVVESAESLKRRNIIVYARSNSVSSGSRRCEYMKRVCGGYESTIGRYQSHVDSENDEEDDSLTIAQTMRLKKKKYSDVKNSGGDASEPRGKNSKLVVNNNDSEPCQMLALIRADGDEETDESGSKAEKNMALIPFDKTNSSDPTLGPNGVVEMNVSETRQPCDNEIDVYGRNADMINDGNKEPKYLLLEDGVITTEKQRPDEKLCNEAAKEDNVVDDERIIQKKPAIEELALKEDNNESNPPQKFASGGTNGDETRRAYKSMVLNPYDESNIHIALRDGTQGQDCLLHDHSLQSKEETVESNERDADNDSYEKRFHELKLVESSIEERIIKAQRNVAWLKERRAIKQRKIAAAPLI